MQFRVRTLLALVVAIPLGWFILYLLGMLAVAIQQMLDPYWPDF